MTTSKDTSAFSFIKALADSMGTPGNPLQEGENFFNNSATPAKLIRDVGIDFDAEDLVKLQPDPDKRVAEAIKAYADTLHSRKNGAGESVLEVLNAAYQYDKPIFAAVVAYVLVPMIVKIDDDSEYINKLQLLLKLAAIAIKSRGTDPAADQAAESNAEATA